jgi:hypothetical protein
MARPTQERHSNRAERRQRLEAIWPCWCWICCSPRLQTRGFFWRFTAKPSSRSTVTRYNPTIRGLPGAWPRNHPARARRQSSNPRRIPTPQNYSSPGTSRLRNRRKQGTGRRAPTFPHPTPGSPFLQGRQQLPRAPHQHDSARRTAQALRGLYRPGEQYRRRAVG